MRERQSGQLGGEILSCVSDGEREREKERERERDLSVSPTASIQILYEQEG